MQFSPFLTRFDDQHMIHVLNRVLYLIAHLSIAEIVRLETMIRDGWNTSEIMCEINTFGIL